MGYTYFNIFVTRFELRGGWYRREGGAAHAGARNKKSPDRS